MEKKTFVPASAFSPSLHPSSSSFSSSSSPPPALSSLSSTSKGGGEGEEEEREEGEIVGEKSSEKSLQSNSHHACRECSLPFMGAGDAFPWISQLIKSLSFFILLASLLIYTTWHLFSYRELSFHENLWALLSFLDGWVTPSCYLVFNSKDMLHVRHRANRSRKHPLSQVKYMTIHLPFYLHLILTRVFFFILLLLLYFLLLSQGKREYKSLAP